MATGALLGAYNMDDSGALRALLPLSGRTVLEHQARCASAAGASPIVVVVEEIPAALNQALERLQREGIAVTASSAAEAADRFEPGDMVLLVEDGIVTIPDLVATATAAEEPVIYTVPDDEEHEQFERIDAVSRWAGVALVDARTLGATAAILGDWDLQSTLLRRILQAGGRTMPMPPGAPDPILATKPADLDDFSRRLVTSSRAARRDWASRYLFPVVEDAATEALAKTSVRAPNVLQAALLLTLAAALAFLEGWRWVGLVLLLLSAPLDLVARRLGTLRLRPLPAQSLTQRLLWPAAGVALLALGWWQARQGSGWLPFYAAAVTAAFAEAARLEQEKLQFPQEICLISRRNAIVAMLPFAAFGAWNLGIVALSVYAAASFFVAQFVNRSIKLS